MRFLQLAALGFLSLLSAPLIAARTVYYNFNSGDHYCDIRNCGGTRALVTAPAFSPSPLAYGKKVGDLNFAPVRLINSVYPAPLIDVLEGETVVVQFKNHLFQPSSIHWHGIHQRGTDFMDGVSFISQCPVEELGSFEYRFVAEPAGSHWYHPQGDFSGSDGMIGPLIVHRVNDPINKLHNVGVGGSGRDAAGKWAEINFQLTQLWSNSRSVFVMNEGFGVGLLNGLFQDGSAAYPWQQFSVVSSHCYRFRYLYMDQSETAGSEMKISIDNHSMKVIELDGIPNDSIDVKSITITLGQRVDAVVCPRAGKANYYINFTPLRTSAFSGRVNPPFKAILSVDGAAVGDAFPAIDSSTDALPAYDTQQSAIATLTYSKLAAGLSRRFLNMIGFEGTNTLPEATHTLVLDISIGLDGSPDAPQGTRYSLSGGVVNYRFPSTPLTISEKCANPATYATRLPYDAVVDIVLNGNNQFTWMNAIHLHGGSFWVLGNSYTVGEGFLDGDTQPRCPADEMNIGEMNLPQLSWGCNYNPARHYSKLNTINPPVRDTVHVPVHGWTVIRYRANNPGYWVISALTESHLAKGGMYHILAVAPELRQPTPSNFPQCGPCRTDKGWETNLKNNVAAKLTAKGQTVFPPSSNADVKTTTNVYCNNPNQHEDEGSSRVNINFQNLLNGFGATRA